MPVILSSIGLAVVLALVAGFTMNSMQEPIYRSFPTQSVRVGDPGHNLVGPNWTGDPKVPSNAQRAASAGADGR